MNHSKSEQEKALETIQSQHLDFIHDVAFDHYGRRIATCSGDRTVKVWDLNEKGEWTFGPGSDWQAHRGSVTRLSWAHPEFGQLLATCGSDHTCMIWEERDASFSFLNMGDMNHNSNNNNNNSNNNNNNNSNNSSANTSGQDQNSFVSRWVKKAEFSKAVNCVQFAPRHLGLKLATGGADGVVRIYEAIDVMNLNHWPMNGSIDFETKSESDLGVTSLSWCGGRFEPPTLVIGGSSSKVSVYSCSNESRQWHLVAELPGHAKGVYDVSWAPNIGRSYHLIASAGTDHMLKVHRLKRKINQSSSDRNKTTARNGSSLVFESTQVLDTGLDEVWRCSWNVTGTVLASSGDGGIVQLWKCDFRDNSWKCVSKVQGGDATTEQALRM